MYVAQIKLQLQNPIAISMKDNIQIEWQNVIQKPDKQLKTMFQVSLDSSRLFVPIGAISQVLYTVKLYSTEKEFDSQLNVQAMNFEQRGKLTIQRSNREIEQHNWNIIALSSIFTAGMVFLAVPLTVVCT